MGDVGGGLEVLDRKFSSPLPDPAWFGDDCLSAAEEAVELIVYCVHPTRDSEEIRRDIIDHIQQLLKDRLACEVFPYGSVPLKTYLPDGDIDLTVFKGPNIGGSLAHDVLAVLKEEELNENSKYRVNDSQLINAEVKIIKCIVESFIIDISFDQLGGLSTLCFLEQIDRIVGKNHLFKRSVVLIKAWCYYESRILGANHGLISTYALETLILYIFHLYQSSLKGPVSVLYRFLEYYSRFDWDTYCMSLKGPVHISSLPDRVVEIPESECTDLMFSEEVLENCMEMFSVPLKGVKDKPKVFPVKNLNIVDPLKESNNLGRSIGRSSFYRIRSAFRYGVKKLGHALLQPRDKVAAEVSDFFANTLARHGHQLKFDDEDTTKSVFTDVLKKVCSEPASTEGRSFDLRAMNIEIKGESEEDLNPLADFSGDYDSNIRNLITGQFCQGFTESAPDASENPHFVTMVEYQVRNVLLVKKISQMNPRNFSIAQNVYSSEAKQNSRGTGTYFPLQKGKRYSERRNNNITPGNLKKSIANATREERSSNVHVQSDSAKIEFGSIGNLAEELSSPIANGNKGSTSGTNGNARRGG